MEFWAAIVLDFAEVPPHMFTSMFTCARTGGWSAHILEQKRTGRLIRPVREVRPGPPSARPTRSTAGTRTGPERSACPARGWVRPRMPVSLTFVGNATVLLRWGPFTLLTDPNFLHAGQRAYLGHGLSTTRLLEPALSMRSCRRSTRSCCPTCTATTGTGSAGEACPGRCRC